MIDYSRVRKASYHCDFCDEDVVVKIPWGGFLKVGSNGKSIYSIELYEERQGRTDRFIETIFCRGCGCVGGLKSIETTS